jgi:NADPH2:quinone reductase
MQAAFYEQKGTARDVLRVGDMETPRPSAGDVLVRVRASAVNPSDTKTRSGWRATPAMPYPRIVPHQDGAGVIEAAGDGVPRSRVGERVWIYEAQWQRPFGSSAEYVVVPAERAVRLPDHVTFSEGACLGIPAMTAHRCVFADGPVSEHHILVTGGAGVVGFYAIQFAKWGGATVIATVSSNEKAARARDAGADHVVNYRTDDVAARVREISGGGVHRIIEVALGANLATSASVLRPNGVIAAYASDDDPEPRLPFRALLGKDATLRTVLVYVMPRAAKDHATGDITACLERRLLRHQIAAELPLHEIATAHEMVETGRRIGAVVLTL